MLLGQIECVREMACSYEEEKVCIEWCASNELKRRQHTTNERDSRDTSTPPTHSPLRQNLTTMNALILFSTLGSPPNRASVGCEAMVRLTMEKYCDSRDASAPRVIVFRRSVDDFEFVFSEAYARANFPWRTGAFRMLAFAWSRAGRADGSEVM